MFLFVKKGLYEEERKPSIPGDSKRDERLLTHADKMKRTRRKEEGRLFKVLERGWL